MLKTIYAFLAFLKQSLDSFWSILEKNALSSTFLFNNLVFCTPSLTMYHYIFLWLKNKNIVIVQQKQVIYEQCRYYAVNCVYQFNFSY